MRLTLVGPAPPLKGGIAHHVYCLQRELSARGHEVQTISFRQLYPPLLLRVLTGRQVSLDTSAAKLETASTPVLHSTNPVTWFEAARMIRQFSPRATVIQWWNPFFAPVLGSLARLGRRAGTRIIFDCHNVFPHEQSILDRLALRFAFSPAHAFIVHSETVRAELQTITTNKPFLVTPLPTIQTFAAESRSDRSDRVILFFGLVRKYKGLDVLLTALPKVLSRVECSLIVAGEFYEPAGKYIELIRELDLEEHVRIENRYIANEEIPALFAQADVLVMPYRSATQSAVVGLAFQNHLPIIASRTGGLAEVIEENVNGLLFPPGDADALAERLLYYFENNLGPVLSGNLENRQGQGMNACDAIEKLARQVEPGTRPL